MRFTEPWADIAEFPNPQAMAEVFEREACRECSAGHPLHGEDLRLIARREDMDCALFELRDPLRYSFVHLTFSSKPEPLPFPRTQIYASVVAAQRRIDEDSREWSGEVG